MTKLTKSFLILLAFSLLLTGCGKKTEEEELEVVRAGAGDFKGYGTLPEMIDYSDLIVEGVFVSDDDEQEVKYEYMDIFGKAVPLDGYAFCDLKITRIFKGNPEKDTIKIAQMYYRYTNTDGVKQIITISNLTPMKKGDRWLFFLKYDAENDRYFCQGDERGRFPIPDEEKAAICEELLSLEAQRSVSANKAAISNEFDSIQKSLSAEEFGRYDLNQLNPNLYAEIYKEFYKD